MERSGAWWSEWMGRRAGGWAGVSTTELFHSAPLRVGNPVKSACHSGEYAKT